MTKHGTVSEGRRFVSKQKKLKRFPIVTYFLLILLSLYIIVPFWIVFVSGIKTVQEASAIEFTWWPKRGVTWLAFKRVFEDGSLLRGFGNTLKYGLLPLPLLCFRTPCRDRT